MARLLRSEGYDVACATNGLEAMASLETKPADLVLLDVLMPKMNGVQFLDALRKSERWRETPVIAITGVQDRTSLQRLRELSVRSVIHKGQIGRASWRE